MKVIHHRLRYRPGDVFSLHYLTDLHLGHALCDEDALSVAIKEVADDPFALWVGGGDTCDFINRGDKRHRESNLAPWLHGVDDIAQAQIDRTQKFLAPIGDKCIGLISGNHEDFILDRYERDVYSALIEAVKSPKRKVRLGVQGFLVLLWSDNPRGKVRWKTVLYVHHGVGGGLLPGSDALALGRLPTWYEFDIALLGHRHRRHFVPNTRVGPMERAERVEVKEQYMIYGGSYLSGIDIDGEIETYVERKGLPHKAVGGVTIKITPGEQKIRVVI